MKMPPAVLKPVADAIGDSFQKEELANIVLAATGNPLFTEYASSEDPLRKAVRRTLDALIEEGTERWLLTSVLVSAAANEQLRRLIVKASPETLASLPNVNDEVDRALKSLEAMKVAVWKPEFMPALKQSSDKISAISDQIRTLAAYKDLHECLHALHLKLAYRSEAAADDLARVKEIEGACATARAAAAALGVAAKDELSWIAELEQLAIQLRPAVAAADAAATQAGFGQAQRLIRFQLSRLNTHIFDAAKDKLSLAELIEVLPKEAKLDSVLLDELSHAIHDLKATVMARALVHKIWQDAENELSLIEDVLDLPANGIQQFVPHWLALRSQVLWLASLDRDAEWAKLARTYSERVDTELTKEQRESTVRPSFEDFCRLLKFRFLAVDAMLKADCGSLGKLHAPLKSMVEEVSHA